MSASPPPSVPEASEPESSGPELRPAALGEPEDRAAFFGVADAARDADGADPFNEQTRLDVESGRRTALLVRAAGRVVGAAVVGGGELDLAVLPAERRHGVATAVVSQLIASAEGPITAWAHGDHPAAARLADRFGFARVRTLLKLGMPLAAEPAPVAVPAAYELTALRPGLDDEEWVDLNARIFAAHPEQGALTVDDLRARQAEPWFDAGDVLLLRDASGRLVGYDWVKVEPGAPGEIYVLGVAPEAAGGGLGRALLAAGLWRLRDRGCAEAELYVEGDNAPALALYRSAGFTDRSVDIHYRRD
jgi:mycothiol synthase